LSIVNVKNTMNFVGFVHAYMQPFVIMRIYMLLW